MRSLSQSGTVQLVPYLRKVLTIDIAPKVLVELVTGSFFVRLVVLVKVLVVVCPCHRAVLYLPR